MKLTLFKDEEQRQKLNRITHPEIYKEMTWEVCINDFAQFLSFSTSAPYFAFSGMFNFFSVL
jgi:hypothetical protein